MKRASWMLLLTVNGIIPTVHATTANDFDLGLVEHPPAVRETRIFILDRPLADGRNAVVTQDLRVETAIAAGRTALTKPEGLPKALTLDSANGVRCDRPIDCKDKTVPVTYNDAGLEGDQVAGDGIYTAILAFDSKAAQVDSAAFLDRLNRRGDRRVMAFTGREVIGSTNFTLPNLSSEATRVNLVLTLSSQRPQVVSALQFPTLPIALPVTTDPKQTVMIVNPLVIADPSYTYDPCKSTYPTNMPGNDVAPNAPWSFKTLMSGIASPTGDLPTLQVFLADWKNQWFNPTPPFANGFLVPKRGTTIMAFMDSFNPNGGLDLDQLPFRLLAISNRIDLAKATAYGPGSPGELRFVFGSMIRAKNGQCQRAAMTTILEYKLPAFSCGALQKYAKAWQSLGNFNLNNPSDRSLYLSALKQLTDTVTKPNAMPSKPNGSAIGQVRTSERVYYGGDWELREFTLLPTGANGAPSLRDTPLAQTPDKSRNGTPDLYDYMLFGSNTGPPACLSSATRILRESHCVPLAFNNQPFRGVTVTTNPTLIWDGSPNGWSGVVTPPNLIGKPIPAELPSFSGQTRPAKASDLRFKFAVNTCNGCHSAETGTDYSTQSQHVHVDPVYDSPTAPGEADLSGFLKGIQNVQDPVWGDARDFNDLQRRGQMLEAIADQSCVALPMLPMSPLFAH